MTSSSVTGPYSAIQRVAYNGSMTDTTVASRTHAPLLGVGREDLAPGDVVNGRYTVLEAVGEGGMGRVYRVRDALYPERPLALKTIRAVHVSAEEVSLFEAEFRTMTALSHPNIAAAFDFAVIEATTTFFFTMEHVPGRTLDRALAGAGWRAVVDALVQLCRALSYLHSRKLLHLDVKPTNAVLAPDGRVKLLDFGVTG